MNFAHNNIKRGSYESSAVVRDILSTYNFLSRTEIWSLIQINNLGAGKSLATYLLTVNNSLHNGLVDQGF